MSRVGWLHGALRRASGGAENFSARARLRALLPLIAVAAFFAVVALIGAAHVTLRLEELSAGRALSLAHETRDSLEKERQELVVEIGALKGPERVLPAAREKMNLLPPRADQTGSPPP